MKQARRYVEYDLLRIIACFCVIMIHSAVFEQGKLYDYTSWEYQAINIWGVLSRWAVPCFVMLSGMLTIPNAKEQTIKKILFHRVFRMLLVYVAWSAVYSFYNTYVLEIVYAPTKLKTFIDGCFSGETHMWYLPVMAGLYCISPILSVLIESLDKKWMTFWLLTMGVVTSIIPFFVHLDIKFFSTVIKSISGYMDLKFLGGWTLYYVLGVLLNRHEFSKHEKLVVYMSSTIALAFTLYGTVCYSFQYGKTMGILPYEYPNIVILSIGIFVFFKSLSQSEFCRKFHRIIVRISNLTFGIYLFHILSLKIWYSIGVNIQLMHPIISIPIVSLVVFISSGIVIWFIRKIPYIGTYFA